MISNHFSPDNLSLSASGRSFCNSRVDVGAMTGGAKVLFRLMPKIDPDHIADLCWSYFKQEIGVNRVRIQVRKGWKLCFKDLWFSCHG